MWVRWAVCAGAYIATDSPSHLAPRQGPLSSTVLDFWRMLWHQNTTVVVMVARVVEMGKVSYLPVLSITNSRVPSH